MTKLQRIIASAVASGSLLVSAALPLMAQTTVVITDNGAGSNNSAVVTQTTVTTVNQSNTANVVNDIDADAETGDNDANFNTGGDVTISTGKASVAAVVTNDLNSNAAQVGCCASGATEVEIKGNGAFSDNLVTLGQSNVTAVSQSNSAKVKNLIEMDADSGENDANMNTGGDVTILTGNAKTSAVVSTHANENWAKVGPALGGLGSSTVSLKILDNGAGSTNWIVANLAKISTLDQSNSADVKNDVDADAESGDNDANFNTGGEVLIDTGDAEVAVGIDNDVNFNYADMDCGCAMGLIAKIEGNGADPFCDKPSNLLGDNAILATLTSIQTFGQGNGAYLTNLYDDDNDVETGENEIKMSTGEGGGDPSILTGNAAVTVGISNSGNVNSIGSLSPLSWPLPSVQMSFDWVAFWAFFGLHVG